MGISFVYISKSLNIRVRIKNNFHRIKVCVFLNALSHLPTICSDEFSVNLTESEGNEPDPPQSDRSSFNDTSFLVLSIQDLKFIDSSCDSTFLFLLRRSIFANSCKINKKKNSDIRETNLSNDIDCILRNDLIYEISFA